ncbi:MAG: radical SAM protein [Paracoccaceae bacterium]
MHLTDAEIDAWPPEHLPASGDPRAPLCESLARHGQFGPRQLAGRAFAMACVALEITQRCNLDCTLCYLSERAEAVHDLPLAEIRRRIARIRAFYGPGTTVQVTGGDPTLRKADDLVEIVRSVRAEGLRAALFTNGIRATRPLLVRLAAAGLQDVAFHVDLTQERAGFPTEMALAEIRADYLARARGLGLRVIFNTTIFDGNRAEIPALARWFRDRAAEITMASFQLQAETGRGVAGGRETPFGPTDVAEAIQAGLGVALDFGALEAGHSECNRAAAIAVMGSATAPLHDRALMSELVPALAAAKGDQDWNDGARTLRAGIRAALGRPRLAFRAVSAALRLAARLAPGIGHRPARLSFMIHNFMDAGALDRARCEACVFMTMTARGPISMCLHNARRDAHVLAPLTLPDGQRWHPETGGAEPGPVHIPPKRQKGRARAARPG